MATDTVRVRPWPGLILDGIPPSGADIPRSLAEEWIGNRLVVAVKPDSLPQVPKPGRTTKPAANARKRRRSR